MTEDNEDILLSKEFEKNRIDKIVAETETENAKQRFAEEINLYRIDFFQQYNKPIKLKKPWKMRFKEAIKRFFNRIYNVFSNEEEY